MWNKLLDRIEWLNKAKKFLKEVRAESKKVSWPSQEQLTAGTILVLICVVAIAIYMGGMDYIFAYIFKLIAKVRGG